MNTNKKEGILMNPSNVISLAAKRIEMKQKEPLMFIVSEDFPDGKVMTIQAYKELQKHMDRCDRQTHQALVTDPEMAVLLVGVLTEVQTLEDILALKVASR